MFQNGQKVVCVNSEFSPSIRAIYHELPVKDVVYTVRATYVGRGKLRNPKPGDSDGEIGLLLTELKNEPDPFNIHKQELGFNSERFAPVQETEQRQTARKLDVVFL